MKLQQKVILAQLPLGLIIAIMGFLFVFTIGHIGSNTNDILVSNYRSIVALQKMRQSLDGFDNTVWRLMTKEYKSKGEILYLIDNYKQGFETQLAVQKSNVVIEGELESTESLESTNPQPTVKHTLKEITAQALKQGIKYSEVWSQHKTESHNIFIPQIMVP